MITEKLYQKDVYMRECSGTILDMIRDESQPGSVTVVLDKTIFFPTGGGQPCDLGFINGTPVIDVTEKDGIVYHVLSVADLGNRSLEVGDPVRAELDWARRFEHMQRHCGEHILSGIFFQETGGVNRGFHMGEAYMTIDIDVKEISRDQAMKVELLANQAIWADLPVTTRYFQNREDAEKLPLRKDLALDEDITIVCVGSEKNAADCVACCGTHPSSSGQVGLIKIIRLESYKGMTRVYFKAGREALLDYQNKSDILTELNRRYSSDDNNLIDKIKIQEEKNKTVRQELHALKTALLAQYSTELTKEMNAGARAASDSGAKGNSATNLNITVKEYDYLKVDDLLNLGRQVSNQFNGLLLLVSPVEYTVLLFSNGKPDCGKLVRENAGIYNGKGGGNATNARAIFTNAEYLETFIDLIRKHLK